MLTPGLEEFLREVDQLPRAALRQVLPVLQQAKREAEKDLKRWLHRVDGDESFTAQRYRQVLRDLRNTLKVIRHLEPSMLAALRTGARDAALAAAKHVTGVVPLARIHHFATDELLLRRYRASARLYASDAGRAMKRQLAVGVARGESVDELVVRLMRPGSIGEGLFQGERYRAERLVRTEVMHEYNGRAHEDICEVMKIDTEVVEVWDSSLDFRVCPDCGAMDGKVVKPNGQLPPLHPNCRCVVVAWRSGWQEARKR